MKQLSNIARVYILLTIALGLALFGFTLSRLTSTQLPWIAILGILGAASLILKVEGATNRSYYDVSFLIFGFTIIFLGEPAAIAVIVIATLVAWAWYRYPWYIQGFNIAAYIFQFQVGGLVYRWINPGESFNTITGILAAVGTMAIITFLNHLMLAIVVLLARKQDFQESGLFDFLPLMIDFTLLCMGVGAALLWLLNPFAIILILIPVYLIFATLRVPALERQSETDSKTGLYNSGYFDKALSGELNRAHRFDRPLTVVMADLDHLRVINNTHGHLAGDEVLIGAAAIMRHTMREYDVAARFGGEEFALLFPETHAHEILPRIEAIRKAVEVCEFNVNSSIGPIHATISFGIAERQGFDQTAKEIVHNADLALYQAKMAGRNCICIFGEDVSRALDAPSDTAQPLIEADEPRTHPDASVARIQSKNSDQQVAEPDIPVERRPWMSTNAFVGLLAMAATGLFISTYLQAGVNVDWVGLGIFTALIVLTEWLSIDIYVRDSSVSTSAAPMIAAVMLFGPTGALMASLSFAVVTFLKHKSRLNRLVFNSSNQLFASVLYSGVIGLLPQPFSTWNQPIQLLLTLFAACIVYISTTYMVAVVMNLNAGEPVVQIWRENFSWLAPFYISMGLVAYALIFSYDQAGFFGILIILAPLLLIRISQVQYINRTRAGANELREKNRTLEANSDEIVQLTNSLLALVAHSIDMRDPYTLSHSEQVSRYAALLAEKIGLPQQRVEMIRQGGLLHDVGKLGIPDSILMKADKLTPEEYRIIQEHPEKGVVLIGKSHTLNPYKNMVLHHHERFDGFGYPHKLRGVEIPIEARIIAVADAYSAMSSTRPYRKPLSRTEIITELKKNSGTQFDPDLIVSFLELTDISAVPNQGIDKSESQQVGRGSHPIEYHQIGEPGV
jgi:diguanylate cyclase (GGDEF)-like protein/putative nucleotidyltransferase with HDIG domain